MSRPDADTAELDRRIAEIGGLQIRLEQETAHHILQIKTLLTAEQTGRYMTKIRAELENSMKQMDKLH